MSHMPPKPWLLALLLALTLGSVASAQKYQPFGPVEFDQDLQLFAPIEGGSVIDAPAPNEGYFASYERLNWFVSDPNQMSIGANITVPGVPNSFGGAAPQITNSVNAGTWRFPNYGYGNRYEMGYIVDCSGWMVGVIDGFDQHTDALFGFDDPATPFGNVVVLFNDPMGVFSGYVDLNGGVGELGEMDGFADDINGNGVYGPDGIDTDGNGVPDTDAPVDLGDIVPLVSTFDTMSVRSRLKMSGVELMKMFRMRPWHNGSHSELYVGARYLKVNDEFNVTGLGGTIGDAIWFSRVDNQIIGPQIGGRWFRQRGRWKIAADGRFLAGFNVQSLKVSSVIGTNVQAGELNQPLYLQPTATDVVADDDHFSPVGELRLEANYQFTKAIAFRVAWTGLYTGAIGRASNTIDYTLPRIGVQSGRTEGLFANGISVGVVCNR